MTGSIKTLKMIHIKKQKNFRKRHTSFKAKIFLFNQVRNTGELKREEDPSIVVQQYLWPLDGKEIKPVHPKGNHPWIFLGRAGVEAEAPVLWPPDVKSWLTGKDPDAGKDWGLEEKEVIEDEMVGWHHWLNGLEFEQALGDGEGQGSLACCSPWGCKASDMTEELNNNKYLWQDATALIRIIPVPLEVIPRIPHPTSRKMDVNKRRSFGVNLWRIQPVCPWTPHVIRCNCYESWFPPL